MIHVKSLFGLLHVPTLFIINVAICRVIQGSAPSQVRSSHERPIGPAGGKEVLRHFCSFSWGKKQLVGWYLL